MASLSGGPLPARTSPSSDGARRTRTTDLLGAIYAPGCSLFARIPYEERVCAVLEMPPIGPNRRGYAAIVGVVRQKRRFLPDRVPLGSNPHQSPSELAI